MSENMKKYYNELFMNKKDNTEKIFEDVSNDFKKNINQNFEKLIQDKYALDLGYGYGNYTIFLAEKGYNVDAIDIVKPYWLKYRIKNNETAHCISLLCVSNEPEPVFVPGYGDCLGYTGCGFVL